MKRPDNMRGERSETSHQVMARSAINRRERSDRTIKKEDVPVQGGSEVPNRDRTTGQSGRSPANLEGSAKHDRT